MSEQINMPEIFALIANWATLKGASNLPATPGLWEDRLGDFNIAINAHDGDLKSADGITVPPLHMLVNAPDYLAAFLLVSPHGGIGAQGMEGDIIAALEADIERLETKDQTHG